MGGPDEVFCASMKLATAHRSVRLAHARNDWPTTSAEPVMPARRRTASSESVLIDQTVAVDIDAARAAGDVAAAVVQPQIETAGGIGRAAVGGGIDVVGAGLGELVLHDPRIAVHGRYDVVVLGQHAPCRAEQIDMGVEHWALRWCWSCRLTRRHPRCLQTVAHGVERRAAHAAVAIVFRMVNVEAAALGLAKQNRRDQLQSTR